MIEVFGYQIKKKPEEQKQLESFTPRETDDGALVVTAGGTYATYLDVEGSAKTEAELVTKYREMSLNPEVDIAINHIISEAIVKESKENIVEIDLDDLSYSDPIKEKFSKAWDRVVELFNFNTNGYEIFKRWYVDGRCYYHKMIDENNTVDGIQEIRYIDPRKVRKIRSVKRDRKQGAIVNVVDKEFFMYNEKGFKGSALNADNNGLMIAPDTMIHVTSGIVDKDNKLVLSYLHKAIKALNQLRVLEDATVIYRISRAPERRMFQIDVGNLPKMKAEQHVRDVMTKHKNRLIYDSADGNIKDDRKYMTMIEDYWFPKRSDGAGTTVSTLQAGQNLGKLEDVEYFEKKLYQALNIPVSRMNPDSPFNLGRASEITRDELNFQKFIMRLRTKFCEIFYDALKTQLVLTNVIAEEEWENIKNKIHFNFKQDNYFAELKNAEILKERMNTLSMVEPFIGRFYSEDWVKKNVLMQTDEEIKKQEMQMEEELLKAQQKQELMQSTQPPPQGQDGGDPNSAPPPGPGATPAQAPGQPPANPQQQNAQGGFDPTEPQLSQ